MTVTFHLIDFWCFLIKENTVACGSGLPTRATVCHLRLTLLWGLINNKSTHQQASFVSRQAGRCTDASFSHSHGTRILKQPCSAEPQPCFTLKLVQFPNAESFLEVAGFIRGFPDASVHPSGF